jgi:Protein of unknown function (DUF1579)
MKILTILCFAGGALCATLLIPAVSALQQPDAKQGVPDITAMKTKAKRFMEPGKDHKLLERFLGKWNTETRFFMGGRSTPPEKGTAESSWLIKDRWLKLEWNGTFMRQPHQGFMILGYDNFRHSYVTTAVTNMDTAMLHTEGRTDQGGKVLLTYGTLDEYLTGEIAKMVKNIWRFPSEDKMVLEIHDLAIGEQNTKVVEITYTKSS